MALRGSDFQRCILRLLAMDEEGASLSEALMYRRTIILLRVLAPLIAAVAALVEAFGK